VTTTAVVHATTAVCRYITFSATTVAY
jgi:hypothetical protein